MRRRLLLPALVVVLAASAATAADARVLSFPSFRMPSKNIACAYIADRNYGGPFLRCDLLSGLHPKPSGRCREGDWASVLLKPSAKARPSCVSDTVYDNRAPFLAYGRSWVRGPFRCQSAQRGLTCRSNTGHGLFLSRLSWRVW